MAGDWGNELHYRVIAELRRLDETIDEPEVDQRTPSGLPYCGCTDCEVRETLAIAVPATIKGYEQGFIS